MKDHPVRVTLYLIKLHWYKKFKDTQWRNHIPRLFNAFAASTSIELFLLPCYFNETCLFWKVYLVFLYHRRFISFRAALLIFSVILFCPHVCIPLHARCPTHSVHALTLNYHLTILPPFHVTHLLTLPLSSSYPMATNILSHLNFLHWSQFFYCRQYHFFFTHTTSLIFVQMFDTMLMSHTYIKKYLDILLQFTPIWNPSYEPQTLVQTLVPIPCPTRQHPGGKQAPQAVRVQRARVVRGVHARVAPGLRARQPQQRPHRQRCCFPLRKQCVSLTASNCLFLKKEKRTLDLYLNKYLNQH